MKAADPQTGEMFYFIDKCMPFGGTISCSHFQRFSNAIAHIVKYKTKHDNINYLDDFFFVAVWKYLCNNQVQVFIDVCDYIHFPVSREKTYWSTTKLAFLGLVIDTLRQIIAIPTDKIERAKQQIDKILLKKNRKIKLKELEKLTGFLNFLCKAIVPGRAFTRRLYIHGEKILKKNHHLKVNESGCAGLRDVPE